MDFQHKHILYEAARARRQKAVDLYEGGLRVESRQEYLTRHPFETDRQYQIRMDRASYRNFAAPIVDVFSSFICDGRPERTLPDVLAPMLKDVDRRKTGADVFFANIARISAACGARFVLVDMEKAQGATVADSLRAGRRELPYFIDIDADDVFDWGMDSAGLAWAVIHSVEDGGSAPFNDPLVVDCLTLWTRHDWRRYKSAPRPASQYHNSSCAAEMREEESGVHNLKEVPLSAFLFEPVTAMTGNPATDDALSLILRVYRRDSELDKMLFDCAVPLGVFNGMDSEQRDEFVRATSNCLFSSSPNGIQAQYVEPAGTSYTALRESLNSDIASIREIALRMVKPYSGVGESAEAKNIDKQQLDTQLAGFARRCSNAEAKCWQLAYKWLNNGAQAGEDAILTPYNTDYEAQAIDKLDRQYLLEMLRNGAISKQTYLELLQGIGCLDESFDVEEEMAKMEKETKGASGPKGADSSLFDAASK